MPFEALLSHFELTGTVLEVVPTGNGHIHDTYAVSLQQADGTCLRYILQRINRAIFTDPVALMGNIHRVTAHLQARIRQAGGDPAREGLTLVTTQEQQPFWQDEAGDYWRVYGYIEGASTYDIAEQPGQLYQAAFAFGKFQTQLADFPAQELYEILPGFHDTPKRYQAFLQAVAEDAAGRADQVREEIDLLVRSEPETHVLTDLLRQGRLPLRVAHNDTKLNNIMIDQRTGKGICVLDLDTVMPGTVLNDFGDMVRSAAALIPEDAPDSRQGGISLEAFDALAHGYLDATRALLTPCEKDYLAFAPIQLTLEQALRFLADYLNGDTYYKTHRPHQNLDRARTQIAMLTDMRRKTPQMEAIIARYR